MSNKFITIQAYLNELAAQLKGCDPALIMDAVNDASEFLFHEQNALREARPDLSVQDSIDLAIEKFGQPEEVAQAFVDAEDTVNQALAYRRKSGKGSFFQELFGVFQDPVAYTSALYMLLCLATSVLYLIWLAYGISFSVILSLLTIGLPLALLFLGSVRALAVVECRLVETLLGVRMPRRTVFTAVEGPLLKRLLATVKDPYTWRTLGFLLLQTPLGVVYFMIIAFSLGAGLEFLLAPIIPGFSDIFASYGIIEPPLWWLSFTVPIGFFIIMLSLHGAKLVGRLHGRLAKAILVGKQPYGAPHA